MAKETFTYVVAIGNERGQPEKMLGQMFVSARNARRAVDFCKRVMKLKGRKYSMYKAFRYNAKLPDGAMVWSEDTVPWNVDLNEMREVAEQIGVKLG